MSLACTNDKELFNNKQKAITSDIQFSHIKLQFTPWRD